MPLPFMAIGAGLSIADKLGIFGKSDAQKMQDRALRMKEQAWAANAPLRTKGRQLAMQNRPGYRDLSSLFANSGNPYSQGNAGLVNQIFRQQTQAPLPEPVGPGSKPMQHRGEDIRHYAQRVQQWADGGMA